MSPPSSNKICYQNYVKKTRNYIFILYITLHHLLLQSDELTYQHVVMFACVYIKLYVCMVFADLLPLI